MDMFIGKLLAQPAHPPAFAATAWLSDAGRRESLVRRLCRRCGVIRRRGI